MKAMILAAGRGARLKPITDTQPKPLIPINGKPIIVHLIEQLAASGFTDLVINVHYLADQIQNALGDGHQFGVTIEYSVEKESLETGGGIHKALPLLGNEPFIVINSDIITDFPFDTLKNNTKEPAHLVLVNNPPNKPNGDFALNNDLVNLQSNKDYTFSGIARYHPKFFEHCQAGRYSVAPLLKSAAEKGEVSGEHYTGQWQDAGSPESLAALTV